MTTVERPKNCCPVGERIISARRKEVGAVKKVMMALIGSDQSERDFVRRENGMCRRGDGGPGELRRPNAPTAKKLA